MRLNSAARGWAYSNPWTAGYAVARSLMALSTAFTLIFTAPGHLFSALGTEARPLCGPSAARASMFCLMGSNLQLARFVAIGALVVVASGWRPRLTGVVHWWVVWSFQISATLLDGGDQVAAVIALLLIPMTLADSRRWHWQQSIDAGEVATLVALSSLLMIRLQVAGIYLQASVAKMGVPEWANGTAIYYVTLDHALGPPGWLAGVLRPLMANGFVVAAATWGTMLIELSLAAALFISPRRRRMFLWLGIGFHVLIVVLMGLISFSLIMISALLLYLTPVGSFSNRSTRGSDDGEKSHAAQGAAALAREAAATTASLETVS